MKILNLNPAKNSYLVKNPHPAKNPRIIKNAPDISAGAENRGANFIFPGIKYNNLNFGSRKNQKFKDIKKELDRKMADKDIQEGRAVWFSSDDYISAIKKGGFEVESVEAVGGESAVFNLKDGNILKFSPTRYQFSVKGINPPEISRGSVVINEDSEIFYVVQKKVNVGDIDIEELRQIKRRAAKEGCLLTDDILQDGTIKQSNFGWYTDTEGKKKCCIIDLGVLKRMPGRYFYEQLLMLDEKDKISDKEFGEYISSILLEAINGSGKKYSAPGDFRREFNEIISDFIETLYYEQNSKTPRKPSRVMQDTLVAHGIEPLREFN